MSFFATSRSESLRNIHLINSNTGNVVRPWRQGMPTATWEDYEKSLSSRPASCLEGRSPRQRSGSNLEQVDESRQTQHKPGTQRYINLCQSILSLLISIYIIVMVYRCIWVWLAPKHMTGCVTSVCNPQAFFHDFSRIRWIKKMHVNQQRYMPPLCPQKSFPRCFGSFVAQLCLQTLAQQALSKSFVIVVKSLDAAMSFSNGCRMQDLVRTGSFVTCLTHSFRFEKGVCGYLWPSRIVKRKPMQGQRG